MSDRVSQYDVQNALFTCSFSALLPFQLDARAVVEAVTAMRPLFLVDFLARTKEHQIEYNGWL